MMRSKEPEPLRRGKAFHREVQEEWKRDAEGDVTVERGITKPSGRRGRIDVHVDADDQLVAVVEIKASDWDAMTPEAIRRNVRRQIRQIWQYIEAELENGKEVSPGVVFPERPSDRARLRLIEELFEEEGIPVVWQDETIEERADRG